MKMGDVSMRTEKKKRCVKTLKETAGEGWSQGVNNSYIKQKARKGTIRRESQRKWDVGEGRSSSMAQW